MTVARGRVQTVRGPIDPADLGWVLPHEHTAIALWHVQNRWDYWELRRDEPVIVEELAAFRAAGGGTVVDLTLSGVGRDPGWLVGLSEATGLNVVMGAGWYRDAYYPAEALIDRRSVDSLADEIVREATEGVGETGDPARDHRRDRDGQAVDLAARGAGPPSRRPGRPPDRARDHDPRDPVDGRASTSSMSSKPRAPTCRGSSSATPTRTPRPTTTGRSSSAAHRSSSTSSG